MNAKMRLMAGALALVLVSSPAWAQGFVDVTIGTASSGFVTTTATTVGGSVGYFGKMFGVEGDYAYSANIGPASTSPAGLTVTDLNIRTIMGDLLIGPPVGPNGQWRPYGVVGGGLLGGVSQTSDIFQLSSNGGQNDITLNFGGGVLGFITHGIGIRADLRYFKDLIESHNSPSHASYFVRFGVGVAYRF